MHQFINSMTSFMRLDLIESNDWYAMDYEAWLRPVLYNIGIQGVLFALEQKEE